ncbi:bridge-like lipid transfer protein family member 2 isoform X1 [Branchiostoma floridae x Branchiostoma belcheri]
MANLLVYVAILVPVLWILSRVLAALLSKLLSSKLKADVNIEGIGFFSLWGISVHSKKGRFDVDQIWVSCKVFKPELTHFFAVCVGNVKVEIQKQEGPGAQEPTQTPGQDTGGTSTRGVAMTTIAFIGTSLFQLVSLELESVLVTTSDLKLIDTTSQLKVSKLSVKPDAEDDRFKADMSVEEVSVSIQKDKKYQNVRNPTLVNASCKITLSLDVDILAKSPKILDLSIRKPKIEIHEGLLTAVQHLHDRSLSKEFQEVQRVDTTSSSMDNMALINKLMRFLPQLVKIHVDDTSLSLSVESSLKGVAMNIASVNLCFEQDPTQPALQDTTHTLAVPANEIKLLFEELTVESFSESKLFLLKWLKTSAEVSGTGVTTTITMETCHAHHDHAEMVYWHGVMLKMRGHAQPMGTPALMPVSVPVSVPSKKSSMSLQFQVPMSTQVSVTDASVRVTIPDHPEFALGINSIAASGQKSSDSGLPIIGSELSGDITVDNLWCAVGDHAVCKANTEPQVHIWGQVLAVQSLKIKGKSTSHIQEQTTQQQLTVEGGAYDLQLEWSVPAMEVLTFLLEAVHSRKGPDVTVEAVSPPRDKPTDRSLSCNVQFRLQGLNAFFCGSVPEECLLFHIDEVGVGLCDPQYQGSIQGVRFLTTAMLGQSYKCVQAKELPEGLVQIDNMSWAYTPVCKALSVDCPSGIQADWTTRAHMSIFQHIKDILSFRSKLSVLSSKSKAKTSDVQSTPQAGFSVNMSVLCVKVCLHTSTTSKIDISSCDVKVSVQGKLVKLTAPQLTVSFDDHDIFNIEVISIQHFPEHEQLKRERIGCETLVNPTNRAWSVNMDKIHISFPYKYDFAAAVDKTISCVKWVKLLYKQGKPRTPDKLYADFLLKVQHATVELLDDPFEVRLGDNYELMRDEKHEMEKRRQLLENRISALRKSHGLLPAKKVEEMYLKLGEQCDRIYVQRSQKLYSTPMRTHLLRWEMKQLEVCALADPSMDGRDNIVGHMQDIDKDSPYPADLEFSTLWCRMVRGNVRHLEFQLRDYTVKLLETTDLHWWGRLLGAEQEAADTAKRPTTVEIGGPFGDATVERSMPALKFYHDLSCDAQTFRYAWGPCWDPAISQVNLALDYLTKPSIDPSKPLPWWDKSRLLYHGRLTMSVEKMSLLMHASLDPYNSTEEMAWEWKDLYMDWTTAHFLWKGDLDVYVKTASKYDDCHFLSFPNLRLGFDIEWLCNGDPNDHHSVMPCAPHNVPETSKQGHDSYAAFRSQNLKLAITIDIKPPRVVDDQKKQSPSCLLYSSTLKWLQNLWAIIASVSRPIRRGQVWNNKKPRKIQLGRHYKSISLDFKFPELTVNYWASFAQQRGIEMCFGAGCINSEWGLTLVPYTDGLIRRPRADWSITKLGSSIAESHVYLCGTQGQDSKESLSVREPVKKSHFLTFSRFAYSRHDAKPASPVTEEPVSSQTGTTQQTGTEIMEFTHSLVLECLKGTWNTSNRGVVFGLYEGYSKAQILKKNLSTEALKGIKMESVTTTKARSGSFNQPGSTPSPLTRLQKGHGASMLEKLLSETDTKFMAFSEENTGERELLHGIAACQTNDVINRNWCIELINCQVMLQGCETPGCVIASAANARILQCQHQSAWRDGALTSKTTWAGSLEGMQYFATVEPKHSPKSGREFPWLTESDIQQHERRPSNSISAMPDLVGSGQSVGGVVSSTVGAKTADDDLQLQRIISHCSCQFYYASYGPLDLDPSTVPPKPEEKEELSDMWKRERAVDSFTVVHSELQVCTNSVQYAMILDICQNLLLYVEPKRKEASERLQRMRFQLQLSSVEDQRGPLLQMQNNVRSLLSNMHRLERELYNTHRALEANVTDKSLQEQSQDLAKQYNGCKEQLTATSEELHAMISCFKERQQLQISHKRHVTKDDQVTPVRRIEVCFVSAKWRLTEEDGQIGVADLALTDFLYTKVTKSDDSGEHLLELGWVTVANLLPNEAYKDVLRPQVSSLDRKHTHRKALRAFSREKGTVGGISVKEHFEVNVVPVTIQLTYRFFRTMMNFFFPGRNVDEGEETSSQAGEFEAEPQATTVGVHVRSGSIDEQQPVGVRDSGQPSARPQKKSLLRKASIGSRDDIEKMKERAARNNTFLYIKIPQVPLCVSYKGQKDKNIEDVHNFTLLVPMLEYHNLTLTWLDFLMILKKEYKNALLSQAIKEKFRLKASIGRDDSSEPDSLAKEEEDKARLLLGAKLGGEKVSSKKSLFGKKS